MDRPTFTRHQLVTSRQVVREFPSVKEAARQHEVYISENGTVEFVMLSIEAFEELYRKVHDLSQRVDELENENIQYRAEEAEREPDTLVDWRSVRRSEE